MTSPGWTGESLVASAVVLMAGQELHARETFERQGDREWRHRAEVDAGDGRVPGEEQVLRRM